MNHFEKFSEDAKNALSSAQNEAKKMRLPYIGTEHLLLGLLSQKNSTSYNILQGLGVTKESIHAILKSTHTHQVPANQVIKKGLSELAKKAVENAISTAKKYAHRQVNTEHILYSLLLLRDTAAVVLLESLNVDIDALKKNLENLFLQQSESYPAGGQPASQDPFDMLFGNIIGDFFKQGMRPTGPQQAVMQKPFEDPASLGTASPEKLKETPALNFFTNDLTALTRNGKIDPVIGREKEIGRVISILNRRTKNNPVLIGEAGVGKTAIAEGIAKRIVDGKVPANLRNKRILSLDMAAVVAGTKYRGEFEERIKSIIEEAKQVGNVLLFLDEIHTVIGAGSSEGSLDAANILKPALSRGEIQVIGATTTDEYRKTIEKDAALERRFQPIMVEEPSIEETVAIIKGLRPLFESHHNLKISDEAIDAAAKLSKRYIGDRYLPDKAIDLIDEAASLKGIRLNLNATDETKLIRENLSSIIKKKEIAVTKQNYDEATRLRDDELKCIQQLEDITKRNLAKQAKLNKDIVGKEDIATVISQMTGIPTQSLIKSDMERLQNIDKILKKYIIGQDEAVSEVAQAIRRSRTGIASANKPIATFIFMGPTGVGKTELVKTLAREVYNDENSLIRIDMSEFMERHNVSRLIGATAGFVGYEEGGQLTEAVRRKPYSVILFDEIEKAHPEVFNLLLQILDDGVLTDAQGRKADFKNTIIIMTSNIGSQRLTAEAKAIGFDTGAKLKKAEERYEEVRANVLTELKKRFRPEFLNRIDKTICFKPLSIDSIKKIIALQLHDLAERLTERRIKITYTKHAVDTILKIGHDPQFGARPIKRAIQDHIENQISELILERKLVEGSTAKIDAKKDELIVTSARRAATKRPAKSTKHK